MRITVICNDEEYAEIKRRAGLVPLSTWLKSVALLGVGVDVEAVRRIEKVVSGSDDRARRTGGHPVDCQCMNCVGYRRFEQQRAEKAAEKKKK